MLATKLSDHSLVSQRPVCIVYRYISLQPIIVSVVQISTGSSSLQENQENKHQLLKGFCCSTVKLKPIPRLKLHGGYNESNHWLKPVTKLQFSSPPQKKHPKRKSSRMFWNAAAAQSCVALRPDGTCLSDGDWVNATSNVGTSCMHTWPIVNEIMISLSWKVGRNNVHQGVYMIYTHSSVFVLTSSYDVKGDNDATLLVSPLWNKVPYQHQELVSPEGTIPFSFPNCGGTIGYTHTHTQGASNMKSQIQDLEQITFSGSNHCVHQFGRQISSLWSLGLHIKLLPFSSIKTFAPWRSIRDPLESSQRPFYQTSEPEISKSQSSSALYHNVYCFAIHH